jgi:hypothetical protein
VTSVEDLLRRYSKPSSDAEQQRQDAAEALVRDAVAAAPALAGIRLSVVPKGSYKNNTNVRLDSDVDVAVVSHEVAYWDDSQVPPSERGRIVHHPATNWLKPAELRAALIAASEKVGGKESVHPGRVSIQIDALRSRRTSVDIVPSYDFRRYVLRSDGSVGMHKGMSVFPTAGAQITNWPEQQYTNGVAKNTRTSTRYKQLVRVMKNVENALVASDTITELPSYFIECLVYNVPDSAFGHSTLTEDARETIRSIYDLTKDAPSSHAMVEVNGLKWLFRSGQSWTPSQAKDFASKAWVRLGF